jgi:hypothetical protein
VVNRSTQVTAPAAPGDGVLLVAGTEGLEAGDLVMVLQVTGLVPEPRPGQPGPIELAHDPVGRWELARLAAVGEGTLTLTAPLVHSYAAQVTQVIRVPEYTDVRIQRGASLRAVPWNGGTGGVVAFLATGTLHNEGEITATGAGFRGGRYVPDSSDPFACTAMVVAARPGAQKGEGVAVTQFGPTRTGREMATNGGGGGGCPRAGGGGGGNGGAGGHGGGAADVGAGARDMGGQGGAKLGYSLLDHLSFGGGGGSGHGEDWSGPDAGAGGGAILIRAARSSGGGFIVADGEAGGSSSVGGAGGGGAGGSIYLHLSGDAVCGGVSARGGRGGDAAGIMHQAGEGGGGGGGRVLFRVGAASGCPVSVAAGSNGAWPLPRTGMVPYPNDGLVEVPVADFGRAPNTVFVTSPADGTTVSNVGGPPIVVCVTNFKGECAGGPYSYEVFINGAAKPGATSASPWAYTPSPPLAEGTYTVVVKAKPVFGVGTLTDSTPISFTVDVTAPDTFITAKPPSVASSKSARFEFSSTESGGFKCAFASGVSGGGTFEDCTSPKTYDSLGDGTYTFSVRAIDAAVNEDPVPAIYTWTVDTVPPDTTISSAPPVLTRFRSASFQFSSTEGGVLYKCALDAPGTSRDEPFANCSSPKEYTHLEDGTYTFSVRAFDAAGNVSSSPARHTWTVDATAPKTKILNPADGDMVNTHTPIILGTVDDPFSTVQVFIDEVFVGEVLADKDGHWSLPKITDLSNGLHTVKAKATDPAGNSGSLSGSNTFTVDTEPPDTVILSAPPKNSNSRLAAFEFGSPSGATEFECRLDAAPSFTSCEAAHAIAKLADGEHTLQVRARDIAGNVDPTPEIYQWTIVIHPPPVPEILEPADGATVNTGTPAITGRTVSKSTVTVYIDDQKSGVALADASGNWTFRPPIPLEDGEHRLTAETTDEVGNISERRSDERVFTIFQDKARSIGGGLSCASSGAQPARAWWLWTIGLGWVWCRRRGRGTSS